MQTKEQKNEYMRKWYANKIANDPEWKKKKREQVKKSVDKHYKKVGYENSTQKKYYHTHIKEAAFKANQLEQGLISYHKHKFRYDNLTKRIYRQARKRAEKRGFGFNIELSDLVFPEFCPILGIKLAPNEGHIGECSPSLDRIDNTKGYIKGNVQIISALANTMKSSATPEQLLLFAAWVNKTYEN